ncbi:hypothetical protein QR680_001531 [Steinernema hermaphroditum]|uniref:Bicarbonate transporter-like transmembrane domain-containing protein n=1 Tax=Steinernema hermaphroditum TaxID=289476 RepID=A0AA39LG84_9BILA|nr:hypothetical protein QR680_001531 [Steinernema hermaphroditum]
MTESAPGNVSHKPKSIISRKLRKFASETSFSAAPVRADIDLEASSSPVRQVATRTRVFTVRTVNNVPPRNGGSAVIRAATRRSRQDSDDASGSLASDATVVSSTVATPQARHKIKRFRLKRPKSAGNMGQNSYSSINNNETSYTSATIHSLDSLQPLQTHLENERRPSNVYMIDDDSTHEFDEDMTADPNNHCPNQQQQLSYRIQSGAPSMVPEEISQEVSSSRPPDPRFAQMKRRTSHSLLYVPHIRRVSTASGNSTASCPTECSEDSDDVRAVAGPTSLTSNSSLTAQGNGHLYIQNAPVKFSLTPSPVQCRRKSVQTGAPAIGFRPLNRTFDRRASQPTIHIEPSLIALRSDNLESAHSKGSAHSAAADMVEINKRNMLTKRVSWLSMKSLQESVDPLISVASSKSRKRPSSENISGKNTLESKTNSQFGSVMQLDDGVDFESDTPPLDTLSWSCADDYENVTLMYAKHEKIPMKDFGSEIRATMDIDHLLNKSVLLLDLQETSLEEIFAKIIHEMDIQEPEFTSEQVRSVLFTQDAGNQFHILSRTVQSICTTGTVGGTFDYDQTWICALCMLNTVQHRHVAIARLSHPTNLGRTMQDLRFIIIVIAPSRAKGTKTALETTRTFATLFADMDIRQRLVMAQTVDQFRSTLLSAAKELAIDQNQWRGRKASIHLSQAKEQVFGPGRWFPFRGLKEDFKRRLKHYGSDYLDGLRGHRTMQKLFSSIVFLYFACLLPAIAFGVLNDDNTNGGINVRKVIVAQAIGGIFFAIFGGQPMIILLTTVPLAIYIKVIYKISEEFGYDFFAMYACVGLICQVFLIIYAATELSSLMKLATRSAEEMFSLFIAIAFAVESFRAMHNSFVNNYHNCDDKFDAKNATLSTLNDLMSGSNGSQTFANFVNNYTVQNGYNETTYGNPCHRDTSILYMSLMFGTLWLGLFLYNFRKTPYLTRSRREWLADYALPASVLIMSFTGAYCFSDIDKDMFDMRLEVDVFKIPNIFSLPWQAYCICVLLGFFLSFLFFMDQNITSAIVSNSQNKLKKGHAHHMDLFVVAILNMFLSIVGLPWMHGALPHSPLHLRALADVEERVSQGHVHEVIMNVRETRLAALISHILILVSTFTLLPYPLQWIPTSVLHGLFLYMALTSLTGNEMFERLLLLITEQQAYPPTHYIRKVPQRKVHLFTACQLFQLMLLCAFGFSPYPFIEMVFPIVCFFFIPIRHTLIPRLIDYKYLDALDGRH